MKEESEKLNKLWNAIKQINSHYEDSKRRTLKEGMKFLRKK
jgi:hypothetical protein